MVGGVFIETEIVNCWKRSRFGWKIKSWILNVCVKDVCGWRILEGSWKYWFGVLEKRFRFKIKIV